MKKRPIPIIVSVVIAVLAIISGVVCAVVLDKNKGCTYDREVATADYLATPATCTDKATYYKSCVCGKKGTETFEYGEPLGHDYGEWVTNGDGTHTKTCSHDNSHSVTENCSGGTATCLNKATCDICHEGYGELAEHIFTSYVSDDNATCMVDGTKTAHCENDGCAATDTQTVEGSMLGHNWVSYVSNDDNTHTKKCSRDESHTEMEDCIDEDGEGARDGICNLCGSEITSSGLEFTLLTDGTYSVSMGTCTDTNVVIPGTHKGVTVTTVATNGFYDRKNITSVTIQEGVKIIGDNAFSGCTSLTSVTLPDSVTNLGEYAFNSCNELTSIYLSKNIKTIPYGLFSNCKKLESVNIPEGVTSIGHYAFRNCESLTSVTLSKDLTEIQTGAFRGCKNLRFVTMFNKVQEIASQAFNNTIIAIVYYKGTEADWDTANGGKAVDIGSMNGNMKKATLCYYKESKPDADWNKYWHYNELGNPVVWKEDD